MPEDSTNLRRVLRWEQGGHSSRVDDELAEESPLEIRVRGHAIAVTMRTPGHDDELTLGFLASEGVIRAPHDVLKIEPCDREDANVVNAILRPDLPLDLNRLTRHVFVSSSCGVCGKATIDALRQQFPPLNDDARISPQTLLALPHKMREAQSTFDRTGGLHAAALFDTTGHLLVLREDVGRHNAVDKVLGWAITQNLWPLSKHILQVSGRASFELVQKSLAAGLQILSAVSAPSSLAVDLARDTNLTLIGFLRDNRFNVYSAERRVNTPAASGPPTTAQITPSPRPA
jgi:FdhD protein